ncbi:MAG: hypothetical protein Q9P14_10060 [candidate division KSB1 bacterium]|nr:hypothetical protein [candidate division KSB1 bacterium]
MACHARALSWSVFVLPRCDWFRMIAGALFFFACFVAFVVKKFYGHEHPMEVHIKRLSGQPYTVRDGVGSVVGTVVSFVFLWLCGEKNFSAPGSHGARATFENLHQVVTEIPSTRPAR